MKRFLRALVTTLALGCLGCSAQAVEVTGVNTFVRSGILFAAPRFALDLSEDMQAALDAGVGLTINVDMEVEHAVDFWFDESIAQTRHRYRIERHALSERYLITDVTRGARWSFRELTEALSFLRAPPAMPIAELETLEQFPTLSARAQIRLDVRSLPAPMRLAVYLSPSWWLASDWYRWEIAL